MANIITLDNIQVPAHLANRASANTAFLAGLPQGGGFPMIGLSGTRFVVKADGQATPLNTLEIPVVLVSARAILDKTYYAGKYDPNSTEPKSPDCYSRDGVKPDPSSTIKQCEACAGCPMNQFGSGTDNTGNPSKGKACSDTKMLAIYANNTVYGFKVPGGSLKSFSHYVKETSRRGVDLSTCLTVIGFDPNYSYAVLTFNFGGWLNPEQVNIVDALKGSVEVSDIVGGAASETVAAPAQLPQKPAEKPVEKVDPFAAVAKPAAAEKVVKIKKEKPVEVAVSNDIDLDGLAAELGLDFN